MSGWKAGEMSMPMYSEHFFTSMGVVWVEGLYWGSPP